MKPPCKTLQWSVFFLLLQTMSPNNFLRAQTDSSLSQEIFVQPDSMRIYGTLQKPAVFNSGTVVLIIAGSGPTDRNGNQAGMQSNTYRQLADSLAARGIASLRYDKRSIGKSTGKLKEQDLRFSDNVVVAKAWFQRLEQERDIRHIFVAGHSEGSTVGMLLAREVKAHGYISIAGPGFPADSVLRKQLQALPAALKQDAFTSMDSLKAGHLVQKPNPALFSLLRPSVQPYLISWFQYDPQQIIASLKMPVLIIQGDNDIQVGTENADALATNCTGCSKVIVGEMNHVLKSAPADRTGNLAVYNKPELPLSGAFVAAMTNFIQATVNPQKPTPSGKRKR